MAIWLTAQGAWRGHLSLTRDHGTTLAGWLPGLRYMRHATQATTADEQALPSHGQRRQNVRAKKAVDERNRRSWAASPEPRSSRLA